jgi:hypothetical protein
MSTGLDTDSALNRPAVQAGEYRAGRPGLNGRLPIRIYQRRRGLELEEGTILSLYNALLQGYSLLLNRYGVSIPGRPSISAGPA